MNREIANRYIPRMKNPITARQIKPQTALKDMRKHRILDVLLLYPVNFRIAGI